MARTTGGLYVMGGVLGTAVAILMPNDVPGNRGIVAIAALSAVLFGGGLAVVGDRLTPLTR